MVVRGDALRQAAGTLRGDVAPALTDARNKLTRDDATAVHGPTAGPASATFQSAWHDELSAVVEAVDQLAKSLEQAAAGYNTADARAGQKVSSAAGARAAAR